jgi:pimeloyl-ACP methyl ester carboxylesterase
MLTKDHTINRPTPPKFAPEDASSAGVPCTSIAADAPVVLLLHDFPTSSFQYRESMPRLADRYRVIAPDLPGFGFTEVPERRRYKYSFDALARTVLAFTNALGLDRYALYVFDYGAPTGFRLVTARPERVTAIVSQNGNADEEGLAGYTLDAARIAPRGNMEIQLDLFLDYANNVKLYPAFQEYFRKSKPPLLAIWGRHDPFFIPAGAEAYRRDNPNAVVQLLDTGHFALETHVEEIALSMRQFLAKTV